MNQKQSKPNVILIVVDQMRADALSINRSDDLVVTPTLDMMASMGYNFENAYSPVPSCVPARAALLTGMDQEASGRVGYEDEVPWNYTNTLPQTFKDLGYQTECIGKMHVYPSRKRMGFDHVLLHDGYLHVDRKYNKAYGETFEHSSDYLAWIKQELGSDADIIDDGANCNSWDVRPFELPEKYHPTNWIVSESIRFLKRRDPSVPFFLKMSFEKPHAPLNPPKYFYDLYMDKLGDVSDLHIGNWEELEEKIPSLYAKRGKIPADAQKRMLAAYYGLITHIDNQLSRFLTAVEEFDLLENTIFWFVSDHGDQLGEHYLFRKGYPYQGSIKIPAFIFDPGNLIAGTKKSVTQLVKIQDVFPSLVELATGEKVETDGKSVRQLLFGEFAGWRNEFHGEHSLGVDSSQYILTDEWKFIWFPVKDEYQLFHMTEDPEEKCNLIAETKYTSLVNEFKAKLARILQDREEGFVRDGQLCKVPLERIVSTLKRDR